MKSLRINPRYLAGQITAPPSKSDAHRSIIGASLCDTPSYVDNVVMSDDIAATCHVMRAFGTSLTYDGHGLTVCPQPLTTPLTALNCAESGSTLRFTIPLALLVEGPCQFTGRGRLVERPLDSYLKLFDQHAITYSYHRRLPLCMQGNPICGEVQIEGHISSQFISGLLFSMPLCDCDSSIVITGDFQSRGYVDMTLRTLAHYGIVAELDDQRIKIAGKQKYRARDYTVEADYSNAAFWIVAGIIGGGITLTGLNPNSVQGDAKIIDIVRAMGASLVFDDQKLKIMPSKTRGTAIDVAEIIDLVPILAVLAAVSEGDTVIYNGQRLRYKESDRIKATVSQLRKLGANIEETADGMRIYGVSHFKGGIVNSMGDHRIAMAMAIAACVAVKPVTIENALVVEKSYPNFYRDYRQLGGNIVE